MSYLTLDELKDYIKMSKSTIYKWCSNGQIPYIKTGKLLLFKKDAIDLWLEQFNVPTKLQVGQNISKLLKLTNNEK
jgi:excisionase family DNA binding protein